MKNILFLFKLIVVIGMLPGKAAANHIVGGELRMQPSGANTFKISLIQFWDKNNLSVPTSTNVGNRDPSAVLYIYSRRNNVLMDQVTVLYQSVTAIEYQNKACATSRSLETVTGLYTGSVTLNPQTYIEPEGYYIVWERCCRNNDINNIVAPGDNGMVFYLEFPPLTMRDSSPEFQSPNGQYICNKRGFTMNMSAVDADGDELRYSLVTPMRGNTSPNQPKGNSNPNSGYPLISWSNGISLSNVIPGPNPLAVDKSGILKVTADRIGLYVFTIQCEEYRNGKKIGLVRRDFQLLVIDCNDDTPEQPVVMYKARPVQEISMCSEKSVELTIETAADWSYQWQLNGLNIPGAVNSTIMISDTGKYSVVKSFVKKCSRDTTSANVHVSYQSPPEARITPEKLVLCKGDSSVLLANGGSLTENLVCTWMLNRVSLPAREAKLPIDQSGMYHLLVTDQVAGCVSEDSVQISMEEIAVTLPTQSSLSEGSQYTISPVISPDGISYSYEWYPGEQILGDKSGRTISVAPTESKSYTIVARSENGCSGTATIQINVIDRMYIPTAFSPNHDGHNDVFEIFNAKDQITNIKIFNRWGEVIFNSKGYLVPWDGSYQNKAVSAGSYPYVIKTLGQEYKGEIMILR